MSTRSTIAHGPNFHLYHEMLDDSYVYLELEGVHFEAGYNRVMVPIPIHVWEFIRTYSGIDLTWAEKTDEQIEQHVESEVDGRIERFEGADDDRKGLTKILGSMVYGTADKSRESQISEGIRYFEKVREHQKQINQASRELEVVAEKN